MELRKCEELKALRHASAATTRDDRLPYSRQFLSTIKAILFLMQIPLILNIIPHLLAYLDFIITIILEC